jgi:chemotaxis protein MotA
MLVFLGYMVTILSVFGGFMLSGGHLAALFQPMEFLIIGGAAVGAFIVGNNKKTITATMSAIVLAIKGFNHNRNFYVQLLTMLFELTSKMRKEGMIAIEADVENPQESAIFKNYPLVTRDNITMEFLTDYLRLIIAGKVDAFQLENLMDQDIETLEHEAELPISAIEKVSDSMPAFGIVAAVMGVVHTMESIGVPPSQLGALIAHALVGTFLGVLMGYGFTAPLAALLTHRVGAFSKVLNCIKVVLIATINNCSPILAIEFGRKILYSNERPNSKELDELLRSAKATS